MIKKIRHTKIIITLGPSTDLNQNLEKLILTGINAVRLNFSHGNLNDHLLRIKNIKKISKKFNKHISIICDLQGPKIRISTFKQGSAFLHVGNVFILDPLVGPKLGDKNKIGIDYKNLSNDLISDDILILDDGRIQLKVLKIKYNKIYTKVIIGGLLSNNKGINKLGGGLSAKTLTEKDKSDIKIISKIGIDYIAVSFPKNAEDLNYARKLIKNSGGNAKIISKIERAETVINEKAIDNIILASDAVMIARGDLAIEIGNDKLAKAQKKITSRAHILNCPIITATQMMESMINNPIPTRAEIMDVSNAIIDGTDAIMLSAETAVGKFPIETVYMVDKICLGAEKIPKINHSKFKLNNCYKDIKKYVACSAVKIANDLKDIVAIISITQSRIIPLIMSRINSNLPIFILSHYIHILNLTSIYKRIIPIYFNSNLNEYKKSYYATNFLKDINFIKSGDLVLVTQDENIKSNNIKNIGYIIKVK